MAVKEVVLERTVTATGSGSFGFSILGGAGSRLPAVVCEMDKDGPAALTGQIEIGDRLTHLNGEDLTSLDSKLLVDRIRHAPSPSTFTLLEEEQFRVRVRDLLRKQEEKRRRREGSAPVSQADKKKSSRKTSAPVHTQQEQQQHKMLEIETSVNMTDRQGVVQVQGNRILRTKEDSDSNSAASPDASHESTPSRFTPSSSPRHPGSSSSSLERHADLSSNSSSSLAKENQVDKWLNEEVFPAGSSSTNAPAATDNTSGVTGPAAGTSLNSVGEVTSGGMVIMSKQLSLDEDQPASGGNSPAAHDRHSQSSLRKKRMPSGMSPKSAEKRNGSVRMSLSEEVFVAEISGQNRSPRQERGSERLASPGEVTRVAGSEDEKSSLASGSNHSLSSSGSRTRLGASPPAPQELIDKYAPRRSPSKLRDRDSPYNRAVAMARKMYMLDGYRKGDIAERLSDKSEFGRMVAKEYLAFFEFEGTSLDEALRTFLSSFTLTGETQQRERVIEHFSQRYMECNPDNIYKTFDVVHGLTCALLLLNSDLHTDHGSSKMSLSQFVTSLQRIDIKIPKETSKAIYDSIKKHPLEWAKDEFMTASNGSSESDDDTLRVYHVAIPGTFVEVQLSENAPVFREGYVIRKNVLDGPHKKVPRGKRQWKSYYAYLKGFLLYFFPPDGQIHLEDTSNAVIITHCLASRASDYHKKNTVLQVTTSDWHAFYLQANNYTDLQLWINAINKAAALYSAPPLAAPIGSGSGFQRPTFPIAPTKNSLAEQQQVHESRVRSLERELVEHQAYKQAAAKSKQSSEWFEKLEFLQFEMNRFTIYLGSVQSRASVEYTGPLPTGLIPSPSISTLATSGMGDDHLLGDVRRRGGSPLPSREHSPLPSRSSHKKRSPLLVRKDWTGPGR